MTTQIALLTGDTPLLEEPTPLAPLPQFEVRIPQWQDIVKVAPSTFRPEAERVELRRQLAEHMKRSPTPEWATQVGVVLTALDNAEDLLSTIVNLAQPLLRKLPPKVLPVLGWVLTARDIAEALMAVGRLATLGGSSKRQALDVWRSLNLHKGARLQRADRFLRSKPGFGAAVEGLQTTESLFGTGLSLGPLVGVIQEGIFGAIRTAQGHEVTLSFDPKIKIIQQAAKVLIDSALLVLGAWFLPFFAAIVLWLAVEIAWQIIVANTDPSRIDAIELAARNSVYPQWKYAGATSQTALILAGFKPGNVPKRIWLYPDDDATVGQVSDAMSEWWPVAREAWRTYWGRSDFAHFTTGTIVDTSQLLWNWFEARPDNWQWRNNLGDQIFQDFIEYGLHVQRRIIPAPPA